MKKVVAVSGGFDPIHVGHVRMFVEAKKLGDELIVIINNDHWLKKKKGFVFMPEQERAELILELPSVDRVYITRHPVNPSDMSVSDALAEIQPQVFANGGDRFAENTPEAQVCKKLGIDLAFNVGGGKVQSSSEMMNRAHDERITVQKPWGFFKNHFTTDLAHIKTLHLKPGGRLSLQKHAKRSERWVLISGEAQALVGESEDSLQSYNLIPHEVVLVPAHFLHRLESKTGGTVLEISSGEFDENDIVRIADDYGREDTRYIP